MIHTISLTCSSNVESILCKPSENEALKIWKKFIEPGVAKVLKAMGQHLNIKAQVGATSVFHHYMVVLHAVHILFQPNVYALIDGMC